MMQWVVSSAAWPATTTWRLTDNGPDSNAKSIWHKIWSRHPLMNCACKSLPLQATCWSKDKSSSTTIRKSILRLTYVSSRVNRIEANRIESNWSEVNQIELKSNCRPSEYSMFLAVCTWHSSWSYAQMASVLGHLIYNRRDLPIVHCPIVNCQLLNCKWPKSNFGKQFELHKVGQNFCGHNKLSTCYSMQNKNENGRKNVI